MPPSRRPRLLRVALAGAAAVVVGPLSLTPASAEEPAGGDAVRGTVVRAYADPYAPKLSADVHAEPLIFVETKEGEAVRLTGAAAEQLPLGATVEVEIGRQVADAAATQQEVEPAREVLDAEVLAAAPAAAAAVSPVHRVTIALVAPAGVPIPQPDDSTDDLDTAAELEALVEGPVRTFWAQQSNNHIQLEVVPYDGDSEWKQATASCADGAAALWTETAERIGFEPGDQDHLLLYLPEEADPGNPVHGACQYGWGEIGDGRISGGRSYVRDDIPSVIAHELGHNFSLGHSSVLQCHNAIELADECGVFGYADFHDVMGTSWRHLGSLSTLHARRIGVLPLSRVHQVSVTAPTRDYVLTPAGTRTGTTGLRLAWDDLVYFLEYRTPTGQDTWLDELIPDSPDPANDEYFDPPVDSGVQLRMVDTSFNPDLDAYDSSLLLDGTPTEATDELTDELTDFSTALQPRRSYWLGGGTFHVTVLSTTSSEARIRVSTAAGAPLPRDLSGDYVADMVAKDSAGTLYNYRAAGSGGFGTRTVSARGWQSRDLITNAGDWNGDGAHDLIARDSRNGDLWLYRGNNRSGFVGWGVIGKGWGDFTALSAPGDWNGDGFWDLLARKRDGSLMLYPGNGTGGFILSGVTKLAGSWNRMTAFAASGDWDGNGTVDFLARRDDGLLFLYSGNGSGAFSGSPRIIGRGWGVFSAITGPGDWDGDGDSDLLVRRGDGSMWLYRGNGTGEFETSPASRAPAKIGAGWSTLTLGS